MRLSARKYAETLGLHEDTVQSWCRNSMLPEKDRNLSLPAIVARRVGRKWQIHVEKTELALSLMGGNATERSLAKRGMLA